VDQKQASSAGAAGKTGSPGEAISVTLQWRAVIARRKESVMGRLIIVLALVACLGLPAVGCKKKAPPAEEPARTLEGLPRIPAQAPVVEEGMPTMPAEAPAVEEGTPTMPAEAPAVEEPVTPELPEGPIPK
jgi:hypothetical protein